MTPKLFNGRPSDLGGRSETEKNVYDFLDGLGIEYLRADHEQTLTMEACREVDGALGTEMCKNLFLRNRQKTAFYLLMLPGGKQFHTKELSAQIGSARLSFCEPEYMEGFLGIKPGAVSVMGLMNDSGREVRLLVDREILGNEYIGCHPCVCTSSLRIKTSDIIEKFLPSTFLYYTSVELSCI